MLSLRCCCVATSKAAPPGCHSADVLVSAISQRGSHRAERPRAPTSLPSSLPRGRRLPNFLRLYLSPVPPRFPLPLPPAFPISFHLPSPWRKPSWLRHPPLTLLSSRAKTLSMHCFPFMHICMYFKMNAA